MPFDLVYWPLADSALAALENDPDRTELDQEVQDTLARLADDPSDRRLRSITWKGEKYGLVHTTPVGRTDWRVVWSVASDTGATLEIRYVGPEATGRD